MKLFLKILLFIVTMIAIIVGNVKSSTMVTNLQEKTSFFQNPVPIVLSGGEYAAGKIAKWVKGLKNLKWTKAENVVNRIRLAEEAGHTVLYEGERIVIKNGEETVATITKTGDAVEIVEVAAKGANTIDDALLAAAKSFDDNLLDIADVGFENWKTFQNKVYGQLKATYPNNKIGSQIHLDVTYIDGAGKTVTKTIIPDNLIQTESNSIVKYKVIDAKTSVKNDLTQMGDLTSTCTANQKEIYSLIDNLSSGKIVKVEMYGTEARKIFGTFANQVSKIEIQLELGVDFWVNVNKTDFSKYIIRNRVK